MDDLDCLEDLIDCCDDPGYSFLFLLFFWWLVW